MKLWEAWTVLLQRLQRELRYSARPFDELIAGLSKDGLSPLLWFPSWSQTADLSRLPSVSAEERDFVAALFAGLGVTDLEGQLDHIEQYTAMAEERRQAALDGFRRCAKAYAATGVCAGLGIGIVLL
ncbi:MAG: stage III sporulation protein AB [Clostridia bacterium]|nr:stage III sporulation protein AB [Clostridia bacterium]